MKKFIAMTVNGFTYELLTEFVAIRRHMQLQPPETDKDQVMDAAIQQQVLAEFEDDINIIDFVIKNMTWADIALSSRMVHWEAKPIELKDIVWSEGYDEPMQVSDKNGPDYAGQTPVDLRMHAMAQANAAIAVSPMYGPQGEMNGAMLFLRGNDEQIDAYLKVCAQLAAQIHERPEGLPPRRKFNH